ncbi:MAG TPA: NAD(P)/FAD-dependent oxidoreductase [Feifaniaceae bacterium]|nr:NAD(P)/FAD-dependent oxidoreductase [Feifaniaceae bacterium]
MQVAVIGGGPAGMIAAATAARSGHRVTLLEQNEKLGKKLYITGKGRCNVTNAGGREAFFENVVRNPRFLYSAWGAFSGDELYAFIEALGVPLKAERGGRVFPESDKSSDVLRALERHLRALHVEVRLHAKALGIHILNGKAAGVQLQDGMFPADAVILATGGASYPATGSTGDGYRFARECGHTVADPKPSLIPLETVEDWPRTLSGLTLKNVTLRAYSGQKLVYEELGEMLFAHFGVTGPLVLSASALLGGAAAGARLSIDLKPGLAEEQLEKRLLRDIGAAQQKSVGNALSGLLPQRLLPVVLHQSGIPAQLSASEFTRAQRKALVQSLKALPLTVKGARPIEEAIVTRGGVSVKEVQPSTLESKIVPGLYFAGELLDVDALTGGYNLQIAWSTGALAGQLKGI